jgi:hypothetical protein
MKPKTIEEEYAGVLGLLETTIEIVPVVVY